MRKKRKMKTSTSCYKEELNVFAVGIVDACMHHKTMLHCCILDKRGMQHKSKQSMCRGSLYMREE